jgi:hypothetical protein
MLGEPAVLDADNVGGDPRGGTSIAGEAPVRDHVIAFGDDELVFVFQRVGQRADEVKKPVSARWDMCTVLNVTVRPETLGGIIVAPVEERIESFENRALFSSGAVWDMEGLL